ncbi:fatty acid desaturase family protein [Zhihengliuella salsuginis]|uniref:Fatty acid desaturase n=1 Tax=Zhihengliuella salsuginis TaxID=578222 RepID=A0ABQ3GJ66_9MICC|nr:acyl-CoA desaturase [Zhihengliuella salsuginis]GHD06554.1 fatty acid desaturase [Zhihengliuella salsuginis]
MTTSAVASGDSSAPTARMRATSDYSQLMGQVRSAGLLSKRRGFYLWLLAGLVTALAACGVASVLIGHSWYQLLVAGIVGILLTQLAFIGHEAAHRQVFHSHKTNEWVGLILANLGAGLSFAWWNNKHNRHHANPNTIGSDPDIEDPVVAFTPQQMATRRGFLKWIAERQGYLFFPLLLLEGLNLHRDALQTVLGRGAVKRRPVEIATLAIRLVGIPVVLFLLLPPGIAAAAWGVQLAVFGFYMGASFAPNHKGMPLLQERGTLNFLKRQVLTSRNIKGTHFNTALMGGLNYQIEHHLFPSMPRPHLAAAQRIVADFCAERGISYTEVSLTESYRQVVQYLNRVGLSARDPFECPMQSMR